MKVFSILEYCELEIRKHLYGSTCSCRVVALAQSICSSSRSLVVEVARQDTVVVTAA